MAIGDGIRRNIASVDPTERALLRDALVELNHRFFPGTRTDTPARGGVSWWFKQDEIHQSTHVHEGPEFLPWHREIVNRLEELLRQINPQLSLHYWDWTQDPRSIPNANLGGGAIGNLNLFTADFMGNDNGSIGEPWLTAGYYVPGAVNYRSASAFDPVNNNPADPPRDVVRVVGGVGTSPESAVNDNAIFGLIDYAAMRSELNGLEAAHNRAHGFVNMGSQHTSFRDPFVFLLHSNVDRLFARWQTDPTHPERLVPTTVYGSESGDAGLNSNVEPWSTGHSFPFGVEHFTRPWYAPENQGVSHDYRHISVVAPPCYDTNLSTFRIDEVENPFNAGTNRFQLIFNDVPEEETTWRAAVIRVYTCALTTFRVKPGTEPGAPFDIAVGVATATTGAHPHLFQDVRIWFQYTAPVVGAVPQPHDDGPVNTTIRCDETGQEFQFELRAHSIRRPTVAVQMVLDQSGSMAWPAGTSGLIRLDVLKDAANLFATVIQNNNGLGIVRFDQDAYPPNHPTYPGMTITKILSDADRDTAHTAINAHGAHGATSVGDGLIMGHNQIIALPAGSYDQTALLLLTDGIENRLETIAGAIGVGAVDNRTFAVGLGNEFQVNTGALNSISGSTGVLLSGILTNGTDDFFRVKKFFLQILAAVTNTSIVRDPVGYINGGTKITLPFLLSEADINCRVILLTDFPVVKLSVETPNGDVINEANAAGFGVTFKTSGSTKTSSFNLPIAFQAKKMQVGTWNAVLEIDAALFKRTLSVLRDKDPAAAANLQGKGARYCVSIHSFSNLRMNASVSQNAYDPGSTFTLRAKLKEYDLPVEKRAAVNAHFEYPDHTHGVLPLAEIQPGVFEATMVANMPGIYRFTTEAKGVTYRGAPFTREQILNAAVFRGIADIPGQPIDGVTKADICHLLSCLLGDKTLTREFEESLKKQGISLAGIRKCMELFCKNSR